MTVLDSPAPVLPGSVAPPGCVPGPTAPHVLFIRCLLGSAMLAVLVLRWPERNRPEERVFHPQEP